MSSFISGIMARVTGALTGSLPSADRSKEQKKQKEQKGGKTKATSKGGGKASATAGTTETKTDKESAEAARRAEEEAARKAAEEALLAEETRRKQREEDLARRSINNPKKGLLFKQNDSRWGSRPYTATDNPEQTMATSACGPTSLAMVLASFGVNVTPVDTAEYALNNNMRTDDSGTRLNFFKQAAEKLGADAGVRCTKISNIDAINKNLDAGNPVIMHARKGIFSPGGHFIVLAGRDKNGNYIIGDPGPINIKLASPEELKDGFHGAWSYTANHPSALAEDPTLIWEERDIEYGPKEKLAQILDLAKNPTLGLKNFFEPGKGNPTPFNTLEFELPGSSAKAILEEKTAIAFLAMVDAARKDGIYLTIDQNDDTYRSYDTQASFDSNRSAQAGKSSHERGIAVDFANTTAGSREYRWLANNAANFGFRELSPSELRNQIGRQDALTSEPWHWQMDEALLENNNKELAQICKEAGRLLEEDARFLRGEPVGSVIYCKDCNTAGKVVDTFEAILTGIPEYENGGVDGTVILRRDAAERFMAAYQELKAMGKEIQVLESFRTFEKQQLRRNEWARQGNAGMAAVPGLSDHERGLSVDLGRGRGFAGPNDSDVIRVMGKYGFIKDTSESWHFTFVQGKNLSYPTRTPVGTELYADDLGLNNPEGLVGLSSGTPLVPSIAASNINLEGMTDEELNSIRLGGRLALGSSGVQVELLQKRLIELAKKEKREINLEVNGTYDLKTKAAVVEFQKTHSIKVDDKSVVDQDKIKLYTDGVFGPRTACALDQALGNKSITIKDLASVTGANRNYLKWYCDGGNSSGLMAWLQENNLLEDTRKKSNNMNAMLASGQVALDRFNSYGAIGILLNRILSRWRLPDGSPTPYGFGHRYNGYNSVDCSGFVSTVMHDLGVGPDNFFMDTHGWCNLTTGTKDMGNGISVTRVGNEIPSNPGLYIQSNSTHMWFVAVDESGEAWFMHSGANPNAAKGVACRPYAEEARRFGGKRPCSATYRVEGWEDRLEYLYPEFASTSTQQLSPGNISISDNGVEFIKGKEGLRLNAYRCPAGVPTIGYGHTGGVNLGTSITEAEADAFLRQDLKRFEDAVNRNVKVPISQAQFDALVSFAFNCGEGALGSSTLLKRLNKGDYEGAAEGFKMFVKGGGKVLPGLVKRRDEEAVMFLNGIY